uniref:Uncharacterized protein n=1 Tax=Panagrolaimus sp. ES5 TaxID=591445 RepID=A0AC34FQ14_9BILA
MLSEIKSAKEMLAERRASRPVFTKRRLTKSQMAAYYGYSEFISNESDSDETINDKEDETVQGLETSKHTLHEPSETSKCSLSFAESLLDAFNVPGRKIFDSDDSENVSGFIIPDDKNGNDKSRNATVDYEDHDQGNFSALIIPDDDDNNDGGNFSVDTIPNDQNADDQSKDTSIEDDQGNFSGLIIPNDDDSNNHENLPADIISEENDAFDKPRRAAVEHVVDNDRGNFLADVLRDDGGNSFDKSKNVKTTEDDRENIPDPIVPHNAVEEKEASMEENDEEEVQEPPKKVKSNAKKSIAGEKKKKRKDPYALQELQLILPDSPPSDQPYLRRSKRTRIRPLRIDLGEEAVYEYDSETRLPTLVGIVTVDKKAARKTIAPPLAPIVEEEEAEAGWKIKQGRKKKGKASINK